MAEKLPYWKHYPTDYLADTRMLTLEARGAWMDALCEMWHAEYRGELRMPVTVYGRLWGCGVDQAAVILLELLSYGVASGAVNDEDYDGEGNAPVTLLPGDTVTLVCRRMAREDDGRRKTRFRVRKFREKRRYETPEKRAGNTQPELPSNADETPVKQECNPPRARNYPEARGQRPEEIHTPSVVSPPAVTPGPEPLPEARGQRPDGECERECVSECRPAGDAAAQAEATTGQARGIPEPATLYTDTEKALFQACRVGWGFVPQDWEDPEKLKAGTSSWPAWRKFLADAEVTAEQITKAIRWYRDNKKKFPPTLSEIRDWLKRHQTRKGQS